MDAAVLNQSDRLIAKKNGFNELLFYGDDLEFITAGVVAAEKTLAQRPELVQRFLRGTLKGFTWLKTNEKEALPKFAAAMKLSDSEAADVYKTAVKIMKVKQDIAGAVTLANSSKRPVALLLTRAVL